MSSKSAQVRADQAEYIFPNVPTYYQEQLVARSAKGMHVTDEDGRTYLDFFGGILTVSLGHCEDRVTQRIEVQNRTLQHLSTLYPNANVVALAKKLAEITPGRLQTSFFTPSGTEADEAAVMTARAHTGNFEIIGLRHGYSGRSMLSQALTAHAPWKVTPSYVPGILHVANPYCYRCPFGLKYPSCELRCAQDLENFIQTCTSGRIAGFIAEPIQGVGGFITPPKEYFKIAVEIARKYGGLFICDEVQTGFGRTGEHWFGIEHWGVEPDMMTMAKGIANGAPLGVCVTRKEISDSLRGKPNLSTFGGTPTTAVAGLATIEVMEEEDIRSRSKERGAQLRAGLDALKSDFPVVGDVRGMGLMQALELVADEHSGDRRPHPKAANALIEAARERGVLIGKGGLYGNTIRIAPPMLVSASEVDEALRVIRESLQAIRGVQV